jgi:hypothetical protein
MWNSSLGSLLEILLVDRSVIQFLGSKRK